MLRSTSTAIVGLIVGLMLSRYVYVPEAVAQLPTLQDELVSEAPAQLAEDAREMGDAHRGAVVFFQPFMSCAKCHVAEGGGKSLGPDLARFKEKATAMYLLESVLKPSAKIREGFESTVIQTDDGKTLSGLLVDESGHDIVLRDMARDGKRVVIRKDAVAARETSPVSIMPTGLVNQLSGRQQFLDLLKYLIEIAEGGALKADELRPDPALIAARPIPEYEKHIDHAGMIASLDAAAFKRGAAIYKRLCINCHGDLQRPGSLPTSLRFGEGKFKSGSDPYTMYQTLTRGFGMMVQQAWMVPQQKYDVIHYIREHTLKKSNPSQYFPVDNAYLASLPPGTTRGPAPQTIQPWIAMNYGPSLIDTYEIGRAARNYAYKGIAMRLDTGPGGVSRGRDWMVFDHDTLRVAAGWSGKRFIDWNSIMLNGKHAVHPHIVGTVGFQNPTGPGWANPDTGDFKDTRLRGRDDRPYGPLPRRWAHYKGLYHYEDKTIVSYTVGKAEVLEMAGLASGPAPPVFTRTFNIGPRDKELLLQVAQRDAAAELNQLAAGSAGLAGGSVVQFGGVHGPGQKPQAVATAKRAVSFFQGGISDVQFYGRLLNKTEVRGLAGGRSADGLEARWNPAAATGGAVPDLTEKRHDGRVLRDARPQSPSRGLLLAGVANLPGARWQAVDGNLRLRIPAGRQPLRFTLWLAPIDDAAKPQAVLDKLILTGADRDLARWTHGGPPRWPAKLKTKAVLGADRGPFAIDVLTRPAANPWNCRVRLTGLDFFKDGNRAALSTWDGDVWIVEGIARPRMGLTWQRIASGLFQPLGVRVIDETIYLTCRDQLVILHDLNNDGETDFYQNFNNDQQVTDHFHEFAMGLQTDKEGNFYYAKAARHALPALVPQHGTLLCVSKDGLQTNILATGFRAPNGVCLNDDGTFFVTDQEGHWTPKNRINWVKIGGFYGNMMGYTDVTDSSDSAMEQPVCWITNAFDRSPAEMLWVESKQWGPLDGSLLSLSYGYGKVFVVPHETIGGQMQGGMCQLPIPPFPTGVIRGRFHPGNGQLYLCGMFAWAGNQQQPGGFYRLRYTGRAVYLPIGLHATGQGMRITFSGELDPASVSDVRNYAVKVWALKRTKNYGSKHYNEHPLKVTAARLADDRRTVSLTMPDIGPTWCMEIRYAVQAASGERVSGAINNTIHRLPDAKP